MKTQRNVKSFFVAKDQATDAAGNALLDAYSDISDGAVVLTNASGYILDEGGTYDAAAANKFRFAQRSGTKMLFSPWIKAEDVVSYKIVSYEAPVQQTSYIGYNTTTGSIRLTNSNQYIARIYFQESDRVGFGQQLVKYGIYESDASATELEVAEGLNTSFINNFARETIKDVFFERVCDAVQADWSGTGTSLIFTNGSTLVTVSGGGATGTFTAGDYVRAITEGVYEIESVTAGGASFTIDTPFESATVTTAGGATVGTNCGIISAANALAASWGIRVTGVARDFEQQIHKWNYSVVRFEIGLDGFGVTEIDYGIVGASAPDPVPAKEGNGTWQQMSEEEYLAQGNEGGYYRIGNVPPMLSRSDVVEDETYDVLTLQVNEKTDTEGMGAQAWSPFEVMIAIATDSAQADDATDGFAIVLEDALDGKMPNYVIQSGNLN